MTEQPILTQRLLDAQAGVLGSMLFDPDTVPLVLSRVRDEDFVTREYRLIFQAVEALFRESKPVTPILVREKLGVGVESPLTKLLAGIVDITVTAAHVEDYVDQLRQGATLHSLRELGEKIAATEDLNTARQLLDEAMSRQVERPGVQAMTFQEGYEQFFDRHDGERKPPYLSWGIQVLDERIFTEPGDMVVLGGYPSDGKTAMALQFASGFGKNRRVGFFSFESTKEKLFDRAISRAAMLSYTKIKQNALEEADYKELMGMKDILTRPQVTLIDAAGMTVMDIQAYSQAHHFEVVIIDYLQKIKVPKGHRMSEYDRVTAISSDLQQFGRLKGITVVALSQLSRPERDAKSRKIRPPVLSDLRASGQIEMDADVVMFIYREDYDDKDSKRILKIAKNKEGEALDWVRFRFDGDLQTFTRIAPQQDELPVKKERQVPRQVSFWPEHPDPNNPWKEGRP